VDVMDDNIIAFWKMLNRHNVKYIMVGGFAVNMQGYSRATDDSDLWLKDDLLNRQNLRKAFEELGYGDYPSLETMEFIPGWTNFYIGEGLVLDIMTSIKSIENQSFDECLAKSTKADLDGTIVPFLHINDLIANKKAVFRPKDQIDVLELEKILKVMEEEKNQKKA
jgi:predicted nucleotidyltransferase